MVTKRGKRSTKKVKNLPTKSVTFAKEKKVNGGASGGVWKTKDGGSSYVSGLR